MSMTTCPHCGNEHVCHVPARPDNELRRRLWVLSDDWDTQARQHSATIQMVIRDCARELRRALTYPLATEADEAELVKTYGKTSEQLADEAEKGYDVSKLKRRRSPPPQSCTCVQVNTGTEIDPQCPTHGSIAPEWTL